MRSGFLLSSLLVLVSVLGPMVPRAMACGPYGYILHFSNPSWPDDTEAYWQGDLGVLGEHYDSRLLWAAYRHLNGAEVVAEPLPTPYRYRYSWDQEPAHRIWTRARAAIPGFASEERGWFDQTRAIVRRSGDYEFRDYVANCLDDAFLTAARTLAARVGTFGADSREVAEWLRGQDMVFDNCDEGRHVPSELAEDFPESLRQDRAYQIAAAYFYSEGYAEAEERFRRIAADGDSSWSGISAYLVARALGRQGRYAEALEHLEGLLADPTYERWHGAAIGLRDHFLHRHDPATMRRILAERLNAEQPPETLDQDLEDLQWVLGIEPESNDDLMVWLRMLREALYFDELRDQHAESALERWTGSSDQAEGKAHWWLAAASIQGHAQGRLEPGHGARGSEGGSELVSRLLEKVPAAEGPGRLSILYHRLRLEALAGRLDTPENEALFASLLAEELSLSDRNRFLALHRLLADDLETWLHRSLQEPAAGHYDDGAPIIPNGHGSELPVKKVFEPTAALLLDRLPPSRLFEVAEATWLPELHEARLVRVAWIRALLLGKWPLVSAEAERVAGLWPDLAADIRAVASASEEERAFVAGLAILRDRKWDPHVHGPESWVAYFDHFVTGRSWWCDDDLVIEEGPTASSLTRPWAPPAPDTRATTKVVEAPLHFAPAIFAFADAHPGDPRVPEALHRLVRSTRYSCGQGTGRFTEVSKRAFQRLHRSYPSSPWTKKTPYWFD